jgi:hypothetical protein
VAAIRITALAAALGAAMAGVGVAKAAEVELRLSHWVPAQHPLQPTGLEPWAKSITDASGGRIAIFRGVASFILTDILRLALLVAFPWLVLLLPRTMG